MDPADVRMGEVELVGRWMVADAVVEVPEGLRCEVRDLQAIEGASPQRLILKLAISTIISEQTHKV